MLKMKNVQLKIFKQYRCLSTAKYDFDKYSLVKPAKAQNTFTGFITDKYSIGDAPNGGYLVALALAAGRHCLPFIQPMTVTTHFVQKALENQEVTFQVQVLNISKSTVTALISAHQGNQLKYQVISTFGKAEQKIGKSLCNETAPVLPPIEDCIDASKMLRTLGDKLKIAKMIDFRVPKDDPFALTTLKGKTSETGTASASGYLRLSDAHPGSINILAFYLDACPPPILNVYPRDWVPTMEMTLHFWNAPKRLPPSEDSGWFRVKFSTTYMQNNLLYTDGEIWEADGSSLLAKSRQMARLFQPS